jgi:hypothetical protein
MGFVQVLPSIAPIEVLMRHAGVLILSVGQQQQNVAIKIGFLDRIMVT